MTSKVRKESKIEKKRYQYFDTPEGEDIFKKLMVLLEPVTLFGIGISTADVLLAKQARTYMQVAGRYAYFTLPMMGMATAFVITSNLAVKIRQKDDYKNWVAGAVAAGGIFGTWRKSGVAGCGAAAAFTLFAIIKKDCVTRGWSLDPPKRPIASGGLHASRYDFTLMQERPKNWTTGN